MSDAIIAGTNSTISGFEPCGRHEGPWFVVWTKPSQEHIAEASLLRAGFPTFFPRHTPKSGIERLFPRYGFIQSDHNGQWVKALHQPGVSDILRAPMGAPKIVPSGAVDRLLRQCDARGIICPPPVINAAPGDALRPINGPFSELIGICSRATKDRVWILLNFLGRSNEIEFSREELEAA